MGLTGSDLKAIMTSPGVWRIRRQERSPAIEISKVADHGTGNIISADFLKWREGLVAREVAQMLLI
jgi:RAT1-interacting protein